MRSMVIRKQIDEEIMFKAIYNVQLKTKSACDVTSSRLLQLNPPR